MEREKLKLKYSFNCDPRDLYLALTKPEYLQNWLADRVEYNSSNQTFTFHWTNYSESAKVKDSVRDKMLTLQWTDGDDRQSGDELTFRIHEFPDDDFIDLEIEDVCDAGEASQLTADWDTHMRALDRVLK